MFVNGLPNGELLHKVGGTWQQVYQSGLSSFLKVQPTNWSRPSVWLAAWGKSDSLAGLAAKPHTEARQSPEVWSLFWWAKFFPSLHDFVYQALWKKLRVAAAKPSDPGLDVPLVQGRGNTRPRTGWMSVWQGNDAGAEKSVETSAHKRATV